MLRAPSLTPWSIPDLDLYYTDCVIGGPGSFVIPVDDPSQFVIAIRQKLVLDIAGAPPRLLPAAEARAAAHRLPDRREAAPAVVRAVTCGACRRNRVATSRAAAPYVR